MASRVQHKMVEAGTLETDDIMVDGMEIKGAPLFQNLCADFFRCPSDMRQQRDTTTFCCLVCTHQHTSHYSYVSFPTSILHTSTFSLQRTQHDSRYYLMHDVLCWMSFNWILRQQLAHINLPKKIKQAQEHKRVFDRSCRYCEVLQRID